MLHDWELAPHRHDRLHQLLLMRSGGGMARLDHDELALAPASLVNVPIGTVHAFAFEPGTQGWVITLADVVLDELLARDPEVRRARSRDPGWAGRCGRRRADEPARPGVRPAVAGRALVLRGLGATLLAGPRGSPRAMRLPPRTWRNPACCGASRPCSKRTSVTTGAWPTTPASWP